MKPERGGRDGVSWALFFVRWVLGLIFFMAGFWKTFLSVDAWLSRRRAVEPGPAPSP